MPPVLFAQEAVQASRTSGLAQIIQALNNVDEESMAIFVCMIVGVVFAVCFLSAQWRKARAADATAEVVGEMLNRGATPEQVAEVLRAADISGGKSKACVKVG